MPKELNTLSLPVNLVKGTIENPTLGKVLPKSVINNKVSFDCCDYTEHKAHTYKPNSNKIPVLILDNKGYGKNDNPFLLTFLTNHLRTKRFSV